MASRPHLLNFSFIGLMWSWCWCVVTNQLSQHQELEVRRWPFWMSKRKKTYKMLLVVVCYKEYIYIYNLPIDEEMLTLPHLLRPPPSCCVVHPEFLTKISLTFWSMKLKWVLGKQKNKYSKESNINKKGKLTRRFSGNPFKDIIDETVSNCHSLVGDTCIRMDLLEDWHQKGCKKKWRMNPCICDIM